VPDRNVSLGVMAAIFLIGCLPLVAYRWQRTPDNLPKPKPLRGSA
jgi:hypothetical protein